MGIEFTINTLHSEKAKTLWSFGLSACKRVTPAMVITSVI